MLLLLLGSSLTGEPHDQATFSIPQLLALITTGRLDPSLFATHHYPLDETMAAYDTFADAAKSGALKVVLLGADSTIPDRQRADALAAH